MCSRAAHLDNNFADVATQSSPTTPTPEALVAYFEPLFEFVSTELAEGRSVLIHCLAGAHRAGSAGIACLMRFEGLDLAAATARAQAARPIIEPIHYLEYLLTQYEEALNGERLKRGEKAPLGFE